MIRMVKGTYGLMVNGRVEAMTKHSKPFTIAEEREDELVKAGAAVKVKETEEAGTKRSLSKRKHSERE